MEETGKDCVVGGTEGMSWKREGRIALKVGRRG